MLFQSCTVLILVAAGALIQPAHSNAIKGRLDAKTQHADRTAKSVPAAAGQPQPQPQAPVLESSKKVYNDESIRRSVGSQLVAEPKEPLAVAAPVKSAEQQPVAAAPALAPLVPVAPAAPLPAPVVVAPAVPAAPAAPVPQPEPVVAVAQKAPEPVAAAPKPAAELPLPSERSAPVKSEHQPVVAPKSAEPAVAPVVVVAGSVAAPAASVQQPAPVVAQQLGAVQPQVQPEPVAQSQPEPVAKAVGGPAESALQAKKDEPVGSDKASEPEKIEVPAPDPGLVLSEPIDSTTKLLIDLDEHVQKFLPAEDKQEPAQPAKDQLLVQGVDYSPAAASAAAGEPSGKSSAPLVPYSSSASGDDSIVPPLPSALDKVEKAAKQSVVQAAAAAESAPGQQAQQSQEAAASGAQSATRQASGQHQSQNQQQQMIVQLLDQLESLQNRIQDTINQLVARRRYVMSALLRPMGTYVRRVRTNLERLQNRVNQLQAAAVSVGGGSGGSGGARPAGLVDQAAINAIKHRIDDISRRISEIVTRIRFSLTPTSAPLNSNGRK